MSRAVQTTQPVAVAPSNNVYTVLAIIGFIAGIMGLVVLFMRAGDLGVELMPF